MNFTSFDWEFSCGHKLLRYSPLKLQMSFKKTKSKCPQCLENEQEALEKQELQQKPDQEALAIFESQSDKFKKDIAESVDNPEVKNYYEKMLKRCHKIWAEKMLKIELKEENTLMSEPLLSSKFQQQLDAIQTKVNLLSEAAHIEDIRTLGFILDPRKRILKARCDKWDDFKTRISQLKQDYEKSVKQKFESIDGEVTKLWVQAYGQLKEENRKPKLDLSDSDE
jgi:hypothetical protein